MIKRKTSVYLLAKHREIELHCAKLIILEDFVRSIIFNIMYVTQNQTLENLCKYFESLSALSSFCSSLNFSVCQLYLLLRTSDNGSKHWSPIVSRLVQERNVPKRAIHALLYD